MSESSPSGSSEGSGGAGPPTNSRANTEALEGVAPDRPAVRRSGAGGREATEAGSRKRKKKDKDKKDKKHKDKGKKKKRRRSPSAAGEGPVQLSQHLGRDALYSSVSGHKIKMKRKRSRADKEEEARRAQLLEVLNAMNDD